MGETDRIVSSTGREPGVSLPTDRQTESAVETSILVPDPKVNGTMDTIPANGGLGYKELLYVILFSIASFLVASFVCFAFLLGLNLLFGWNIDSERPVIRAVMLIVTQVMGWALILVFVYLLVTVKNKMKFDQVVAWIPLAGGGCPDAASFRERNPLRVGLVFCSIGVGLACSVAVVASVMPMPSERPPFEELVRDPLALLLLAAFGVTVFPVVEEVMFRGFFFAIMERVHGVSAAVVTTSAVFSTVHGPQYGWHWSSLLLLFCVGFVFAAVRAKTGSVVPVVLIHAGYNATLLVGALLVSPVLDQL